MSSNGDKQLERRTIPRSYSRKKFRISFFVEISDPIFVKKRTG